MCLSAPPTEWQKSKLYDRMMYYLQRQVSTKPASIPTSSYILQFWEVCYLLMSSKGLWTISNLKNKLCIGFVPSSVSVLNSIISVETMPCSTTEACLRQSPVVLGISKKRSILWAIILWLSWPINVRCVACFYILRHTLSRNQSFTCNSWLGENSIKS